MSLRISPPRSDGYHPIRSVFQTISLRDQLRITPLSPGQFEWHCSHPSLQEGHANLLYRIFKALEHRLSLGVSIYLDKHIPLGAGLGGASSNAAGLISFLAREMGWVLTAPWLRALIPTWGADIPFFLRGGTVLVEGIGERLTPMDPVAWQSYLLIYPEFEISSARAYQLFDQHRFLPEPGEWVNDFRSVIFEAYPRLNEIEAVVQGQGLPGVQLSGSGSTVFIPFLVEHDAAAWEDRLRGVLSGCRVMAVKPVLVGIDDF